MSKEPKRPRKNPIQGRSIELVGSIFEASVRILKTVGASKFSTRKVAELAGVSVGSLYQYFPNKDALIGSLIEREARRHVQLLENKFSEIQKRPFEEVIFLLVSEILGAVERDKNILSAILNSVFQVERLDSIIASRENLVSFIEKVLRHFSPAISAADSRTKAYLIVAALGGVVETIIFRKDNVPSVEDLTQEASLMIQSYCRSEK